MPEVNLGLGDPLSLEIASDAHLVHPDFANDHIWELHLSSGEPPGLSIETTFGLRARQMRLFPRFCDGRIWRSDPADFSRPVAIRRIFPNFLTASFSPFPSLDVTSDYWVPESHVLAGKIRLTNSGDSKNSFGLEWTAILIPHATGEAMAAWQQVVSPVLRGQAEDIHPVLFLTGGPAAGNGPFASLTLESLLETGESRIIYWAVASLNNPSDSFDLARQVTARPWEAEIARLEREQAQRTITIFTGHPDWDTAFLLSQKTARSLVMGPETALPHQSFVTVRRPDFGFSPRGDGSEYSHAWNGQTPLDAWYLSTQALPLDADLLRGLVDNFLAVPTEEGGLDMKPGLAGQRSRRLAAPLVCQMAWTCYERTGDRRWLAGVFSPLQDFLSAWFTPERDRDGDGLPEWDSLLQMEFEDHPTFSRAEHGGDGIDITTAEDPALMSLLVLECRALIRMADTLGLEQPAIRWQESLSRLTNAVQECWDAEHGRFLLRDRDTHISSLGKILASFTGTGRVSLDCPDCFPTRLLIHLKAATENTRNPRVFLRGEWQGTEVQEEILARSVFWVHNQAWITSQHAFSSLQDIEVRGLDPRDEVTVRAAAFGQDNLPLYLPLLAGVCSPDQAAKLASRLAASDGYNLLYGMPACPCTNSGRPNWQHTSLPWSALVLSGLYDNGFHEECAGLFENLMNGILASLKNDHRFQAHTSALTGQSSGSVSTLQGLAPLGLFLKLAGLTIYSPWRVLVSDRCTFPGLITVQYQGMQIQRSAGETLVTFPDGQRVSVPDHGSHLVSLEDH